MRRFRPLIVLTGLLVVGLAGCTKRLQATAVQPNPLRDPNETLRRSAPLAIQVAVTDMDSPKVVMTNTAYFAMVTRDRLRFHVTLEHHWQEMCDVDGWDVWLEDDAGRRHFPEAKEPRRNKFKTGGVGGSRQMTDYEARSTVRNEFGDVTAVRNDGWKRPVTLKAIDRFRGEGDYVFYSRDLMSKDRQQLALVMRRKGMEYRYVWNFADGPPRIENHTQSDLGTGFGIQPGPLTQGQTAMPTAVDPNSAAR